MRIGFFVQAMVLLTGVSVASYALAKPVNYKLDTSKSQVTWVGKKVAGQHNGTLKLKSGHIVMNDGVLKSGNFTIDMASLDNKDLSGEWKTKLLNHLKSPDFFNVAKHPHATFKITKVVASKALPLEYWVTGDLTIKGIKQQVRIPAKITSDAKMATAKANFKIDRLKWDIKYNSGKFFDAKKLGDKMIYDEIDIGLDLTAAAAPVKGKKAAQNAVKKTTQTN